MRSRRENDVTMIRQRFNFPSHFTLRADEKPSPSNEMRTERRSHVVCRPTIDSICTPLSSRTPTRRPRDCRKHAHAPAFNIDKSNHRRQRLASGDRSSRSSHCVRPIAPLVLSSMRRFRREQQAPGQHDLRATVTLAIEAN